MSGRNQPPVIRVIKYERRANARTQEGKEASKQTKKQTNRQKLDPLKFRHFIDLFSKRRNRGCVTLE